MDYSKDMESFIEIDEIRTHLLFSAPLKSCIATMAKTRVVTKQRKQILAIEGITLIRVYTRLAISGNAFKVLSVRRARTPLIAEIFTVSEPMDSHDPHTTVKSSMFHQSRR